MLLLTLLAVSCGFPLECEVLPMTCEVLPSFTVLQEPLDPRTVSPFDVFVYRFLIWLAILPKICHLATLWLGLGKRLAGMKYIYIQPRTSYLKIRRISQERVLFNVYI